MHVRSGTARAPWGAPVKPPWGTGDGGRGSRREMINSALRVSVLLASVIRCYFFN